MILLDLKLALFVVLLGVAGGIGGIWWFAQRRVRQPRYTHSMMPDVFETLPFGIAVLDPAGAIAFSNTQAERLLAARDGDTEMAGLQRLGDVSQAGERSGVLHDPLPVRWWRYPLDDGSTLLVLADWSDRQRLAQQQQMFLGHLSHELRTPLTALVAHSEILRGDATPEPVRRSSAEIVQRETQRMARLLRDLLELHRLETADDLLLQPVDLVLLVEDAIAQLILPAEERGLRLIFEAGARLPPVLGQPDRLKQVFLNLIDNAIKYCRRGDEIRVSLQAEPDGALCVVQDNGPGIAARDLPHVTEQLYRGRTDVEGTGIGLALVSEILRRHHAQLRIESSTDGPATGTRMSWTLPYAAPDPTMMSIRNA